MPKHCWAQLVIHTNADNAQILAEHLPTYGAHAVNTCPDNAEEIFINDPTNTPLWQSTQVIALFDDTVDLAPLIVKLQNSVDTNNWRAHHISILHDKDWQQAMQDTRPPLRFGEHLWICPSWQQVADSSGTVVKLDPGMAFGTGTHATTALMLSWLAQQDLKTKTVIDYGCGSGILAIAAYKCQAENVMAIDNDEQAIIATQTNAARNHINTDRFRCYLPEQAPMLQADIVLANILAQPLIELAPTLIERVKRGGHLLLSGLLKSQVDQVCLHYVHAFTFKPAIYQDNWVLLEGIATADSHRPHSHYTNRL